MNPYLSVALAMCVIVLISLALTAYLAVVFNRRAKADLERALEPLAERIDGGMDLDDAKVIGRYAGHIAEGRVATAFTAGGRVFHTSVIDGAGGIKWTWTWSRPKQAEDASEPVFDSAEADLRDRLMPDLEPILLPVRELAAWTVVEYEPGPGHIRLTRPMQTRRDIPGADQFETDLRALVAVARVNRAAQYRDE